MKNSVSTHLLRQALSRLTPLTDESWAPIEPWIASRSVRAGDALLRAGERASHIFFVRQGLLREYYLDHEGTSATRRFCEPGEMSGSLADLLSGAPAMVSIEALEPTQLWQIPWAQVDALTKTWPEWQMLARRVAENLYLRKTQREFEMLTLSAAQRYQGFCAQHPTLLARLPQHLVASYLGITPVHLSRLRSSDKLPQAATSQPRKK